MAIQQVWDLSNRLTINRRRLSGVQITRSEIVRTDLSVTKNPWRFTVGLPGLPWSDMRGTIEAIDHLGRDIPEIITIGSNSLFSWLYRYQGDAATTPTGLTVTAFSGNQMTVGNLTGLGLAAGQYVFRSGDMIQVATKPYPYTVVEDVLRGSGSTVTVTTHRPTVIASMPLTPTLNVGQDCQISLLMTTQPSYSLRPGAQRLSNGTVINNAIVEWDSEFQFVEFLYQ